MQLHGPPRHSRHHRSERAHGDVVEAPRPEHRLEDFPAHRHPERLDLLEDNRGDRVMVQFADPILEPMTQRLIRFDRVFDDARTVEQHEG